MKNEGQKIYIKSLASLEGLLGFPLVYDRREILLLKGDYPDKLVEKLASDYLENKGFYFFSKFSYILKNYPYTYDLYGFLSKNKDDEVILEKSLYVNKIKFLIKFLLISYLIFVPVILFLVFRPNIFGLEKLYSYIESFDILGLISISFLLNMILFLLLVFLVFYNFFKVLFEDNLTEIEKDKISSLKIERRVENDFQRFFALDKCNVFLDDILKNDINETIREVHLIHKNIVSRTVGNYGSKLIYG